jgi:molecular chaperone GrpE
MSGGEGPAEPGPVIRDRRRLDPQTGQVREAYGATDAPQGGSDSGPAQRGRGRHASNDPKRPKPPGAGPARGGKAAPSAGDAEGAEPAEGAAPEPAEATAPGTAPAGDPAAEAIAAAEAAVAAADAISPELAEARAQAEERLADLQRLQAEYVNYRKRVERDRALARDYAVASVLESLLPVLDDVHLARQHGDLEEGPFAAIADKLEAILGRHGLERYGEPGEAFDPEVHEALMHTEAELAEGTTTTTVVQVLQPGYRMKDRVVRPARVAVADPPA